MADIPSVGANNFDAPSLARDIQNNVNLLLHAQDGKQPLLADLNNEPGTKTALAALQRDALALQSNGLGADGQLGWSSNQIAVNAELRELEAQGHLPRVNIDVDGNIEAIQSLPNYFVSGGHGGPLLEQNTRTVNAEVGKPATVSDYRPYDPAAPIPQIGPRPTHGK